MRTADTTQHAMFSYRSLEERIPAGHPLRKLRVLVDGILASMNGTFAKLYSHTGRPGIPAERLLRASLIQVLFSIRSERQLVQHIEYNLLYRWFVGLSMDEGIWAATTFTENRDRLFTEDIMREFFGKVVALAQWKRLTSHEHFTVDGTLIEAWASMKSFVSKDGSGKPPEGGGKNPTVDFKGEKRSNETHASTTDDQARLFKKSAGDKSRLCYMGHALMENRNGLVVDVEATQATGKAEREAALRMTARTMKAGSTLGADKGYDTADFVQSLREMKVTPHVAAKQSGSAIDGRTTRHAGYAVSLKKRKLVEEIFGWSKTIGGLRKTRLIGLAKVKAQTVFTFACYNLTRMATLFGWRLSAT
ncbi:IS5 family transposase [Dechloromonas sp. ZY10]|uniref:IS5 family transposase n=1 Tax=Dechloromonas aquae TaxID=2664436 RepID=UPI003529A4EB